MTAVVRWSAVVVVLLGVACGRVTAATPDAATVTRDNGPARDRGPAVDAPSETADRDFDGLCDATEVARRTDPDAADSDFDGLTDGFELRYGSDPRNGRDPSSRDRMQLEERADSTWPTPWFVEWRGMGEGLLVTVLDRGTGLDGRRITEVADITVEAIGANPAAFVGGAEGARFFGVGGPVRLEWRITAAWSAREAPDGGAPFTLGCRRAYEGLAIVKQDGGDTVAARRLVLDVIPSPNALDGGLGVTWADGVTDDGFCRVSACL